ncbi:MAG: MgtC/SapB family protein [Ignavibacteria bacterium]|nr:MgtC/SapB family protein [Ignavibacteria bacterium]
MNAIEWTIELRLVIALALGFLVGLERESTKVEHRGIVFGGVRTYPIISLYGFACAWLSNAGVSLLLPIGLVSMSVLAAIAYITKIKAGRYGFTSEASALLTFIVGALALLADVWIPMALGIVNTMLLSEKAELESYVDRFSKVEFLAVVKFLLVTAIVLPVLPNQEYTQFHLNPTRIWQIVILVSSIGFVGYFLSKRFGSKVGLWMSGILGGIVSSTATTLAVGRIAQRHADRSRTALQASILASSVMYIRILILVLVVNPVFLPALWWKLTVLAVIGVALSFLKSDVDQTVEESTFPNLQNPFEIRPAMVFALLFVVLSVVTTLIYESAGRAGVLALAAVVGVTDIDPFILSLLQPSDAQLRLVVGGIIVAMMSNVVAKGSYFAFLAPNVRRETFWKFGLLAVCHVPLLLIG